MVIATPCPLLIAIPVAVVGSISLSARRWIIVKSPVVLEQIAGCRTAIFDKTGTLTYGEPKLTDQLTAPGFQQPEVLTLAVSLECYSKHPLARAILAAAKEQGIQLRTANGTEELKNSRTQEFKNARLLRYGPRRETSWFFLNSWILEYFGSLSFSVTRRRPSALRRRDPGKSRQAFSRFLHPE